MLNALGSVSQGLSKPQAGAVGTARQIAKSNPKPYVGREASYSGSLATTPGSQQVRGNIGRQGVRAAEQYAAKFNAENGIRDVEQVAPELTEADKVTSRLDGLASTYNALVQQYRENPYLVDPLKNAMTSYFDALATTNLPTGAPRETQIFQEMVRQAAAKPSQQALDNQVAYFGRDLYGNNKDYGRYSPLMPVIQNGLDYHGEFQRDLVQRLLNESLIPGVTANDKLAADVPAWRDFTKPQESPSVQNLGSRLSPSLPYDAQNVSLRFQDQNINVDPSDVFYNPRDHAVGLGNIFYDVFGGRVANSAWGAESDNGMQDLMFPDAPYTMQGYAGHWNGDSRSLNTNPTTAGTPGIPGYKAKTMVVPGDVPISPNPGERQVLNRSQTSKPLVSEFDVPETPGIPGLSLGVLQPWKQANLGYDQYGATNPALNGRSPMFDVPQNWVAKPFEDSTWEPYAYAATSQYNGQTFGIQRAGGPKQDSLKLDSLTYMYPSPSNRNISPGFNVTQDNYSGQPLQFSADSLYPQRANRQERLNAGFLE